MIVYVQKGDTLGINRWQGGIESRKLNEKEAKANDIDEEISEEKKGDSSLRLEAPTNRRRTQRNAGLLRSLKSENNRTSSRP